MSQDEHGVSVELADGSQPRSRYLVGCDGGRSVVRKVLGVGFPGEPAKVETLLGEGEVTEPPAALAATVVEVRKAHRRFGVIPLGGGVYRIIVPAEGPGEVSKNSFGHLSTGRLSTGLAHSPGGARPRPFSAPLHQPTTHRGFAKRAPESLLS
jgi:hypothetical protein